MHDANTRNASTNAEGKHVHTPESGENPDDALAPGNASGSGDVEFAQRRAALPPDTPIKGGPSREPTANEPQPGLRDENDDEHGRAAGVREPAGESKQQLDRIQERNRALIEDGAEPGPEGEREIAGGETVTSAPPRSGDYSND